MFFVQVMLLLIMIKDGFVQGLRTANRLQVPNQAALQRFAGQSILFIDERDCSHGQSQSLRAQLHSAATAPGPEVLMMIPKKRHRHDLQVPITRWNIWRFVLHPCLRRLRTQV